MESDIHSLKEAAILYASSIREFWFSSGVSFN